MRFFTRWKWKGRNGEPYTKYKIDSRYTMSKMADTNNHVLIYTHSKMKVSASLQTRLLCSCTV